VVACKFQAWADDADAVFAGRDWQVLWLRFGTQAPRWKDAWQRARRKSARLLARALGPVPHVAERALHYVTPELTQAARRIPADLFIGHNLAALPAAARAAHRHDADLGFDAEDFHRGELPDRPEYDFDRALVAAVEERWIPTCDYVTAASEGIGDAYAEALGIDPPTTVLNVFPWSDRQATVPDADLRWESPAGRSLYWFSQNIGPDRGLEDALQALPQLPDDVCLTLRGQWARGYESDVRRQAQRLGVADRVHHRSLVPPNELIERTAQHDVGLALEHPVSRNRKICVTNKLFTYLLAGIPFVATDTPGQRPIVNDLPRAARAYRPGDVDGFAGAVRALLEDDGAGDAALAAARDRYTWDVEKKRFLDVVRDTLHETAPAS
jgi:glycosyltransferase involved in cell wall biosynthesis